MNRTPKSDYKGIVAIPCYNEERFIGDVVRKAKRYADTVIVVDDGSTDESADAARRFGPAVRYCWQPHSGPSAARNRGVDLATGDFLAFLDADDLWLEPKLVLQMAAFDADTGLDMVFGHVQQFPSPDLADSDRARLRYSVEKVPGHVPSALLIRREAFDRVGGFESEWHLGEFMDWYLRALEQGLKGLMLSEVVARRRLHADNLGVRERGSQGDYVRILKASLDRRRGSPRDRNMAVNSTDES